MTAVELRVLVEELRRTGRDGQYVEAKRARTELPRSVRQTVSAFANAHGGVILLGIDEQSGFAATGVADTATMSAKISDLCSDQLTLPCRASIEFHSFEDAQVITVEIAEMQPADKPCFITATGAAYIRVGDSDRRLSAYEIQLMKESRGQPLHDEEAIPGSSLKDLDQDLLSAYFRRAERARPRLAQFDSDERLRATKIVVGNAGELSVAGLLALARFPQGFFPQLNLTFVRYAEEDGSTAEDGGRFLDNKTFEGPITGIVADVGDALMRNMARRATVVGLRRTDSWEYPATAIREAVVNGLVHRDLSPLARGMQVQVEMYPDRLTVRSPGGLHGPVTIEGLAEGASSSRNASLLKILEDTPIPGEDTAVCENRGSGIRTMLASLRNAGLKPPHFEDGISTFSVTFPNHALLSDDVVEWIGTLDQDGLTEPQVIGLALMRTGAVLDNPSYRAATGVDSRIATMDLQDLVGREIAEQHGVRRWATYTLSELGPIRGDPAVAMSSVGSAPPSRASASERKAQILKALGDQTLPRAEIAGITGLKDRVVRHYLKALLEEGLVERTTKQTQSINAKYRALEPPRQASLFETKLQGQQ